MANNPPPGRATPQPSDPWQEAPLWGGGPDATGGGYAEPSGHIADPYSPATGYPPAGQAPLWGPPQPVPGRSGMSAVAIGMVSAVVVVVLGGGGLGLYAWHQHSGSPQASTGNTPTPATTKGTSASPSPTEQDFSTAQLGQCLVNRGNDKTPEMHIVACGPGTYELIKRFDGTVDEKKCDGVPRVTTRFHYGYGDTRLVYCLKKNP